MQNSCFIFLASLLCLTLVRAEDKTQVISPTNTAPTQKFYSNTAAELHKLTATVASGYKFVKGPSLDVNPGGLWSKTGSFFQLMNMDEKKELTATVKGEIAPTGGSGGSGGGGAIPFTITMISRYFTITFDKPESSIKYVLKTPSGQPEVDTEVTVQNAIGNVVSGNIVFSAAIGEFDPPTIVPISTGKASAKMTVTGELGAVGKIKASATDVDISNNEKAAGDKESKELVVLPIEVTTVNRGSHLTNPTGWHDTISGGGVLGSWNFETTVKIPSDAGSDIKVGIVRDVKYTTTITYEDNSESKCDSPGFLADNTYPHYLTPLTVSGKFVYTSEDYPNASATATERPYIKEIQDDLEARNFIVVKIRDSEPQLVAQVNWSYSNSAVGTTPAMSTPGHHFATVITNGTQSPNPSINASVVGGDPTELPITASRNGAAGIQYINSGTNWVATGSSGSMAHTYSRNP